MSGLPEEIVREILYRLPVNSLLRFRCVSNSWCMFIDSPHFVKTHLTRSIENPTNLKMVVKGFCTLDDNQLSQKPNLILNKDAFTADSDQVAVFLLDFYSPQTPIPIVYCGNYDYTKFCVLGSCYGLLLLEPDCEELVLFNPSTGQRRNVPESYCSSDRSDLYGLCYDSSEYDYKVIRVTLCLDSFGSYGKTEAMVYSLESNLWRKIGDCPYYLRSRFSRTQISGVLHAVGTESMYLDSPKVIVGFNIKEENFNLVPKPDSMKEEDVMTDVGVLGGCLLLSCSDADCADVWVMKVYGVKKSWVKLFSISSPEIYYRLVYPLGFSKSLEEVLIHFMGRISWYNLKSREIRNVNLNGVEFIQSGDVYVASLVPLDGYRESNKPKKQHKT